MYNCYITETHLRSLKNNCSAVPKKYWVLEKEEIFNLTIFILFSFSYLRNVRGTYSKYFQINNYESDISSASE